MIPISYNGFGPTAILLMVLCLVISQAFKYYKQKNQKTVRPKEEMIHRGSK
jgi:hypothetical protein